MPEIHNNQTLNDRRKELRKNSTPEEAKIWELVRNKRLGFKFYRQHSIGPYIADFYCAEKRLIIELDGSQHLENKEYDQERSRYLEGLGYKVLRFWNNDVNTNLTGVIDKIKNFMKQK